MFNALRGKIGEGQNAGPGGSVAFAHGDDRAMDEDTAPFIPPRRIWAWPVQLGQAFIDLVYPPSCLMCSAALGEEGGLCPRCWRDVPFIEKPYCARLGTPFPFDHGGELLSPQAIAHPPAFDKARAVARYDGPARALVHGLKYSDRHDLVRPMAAWMARAGTELLAETDLLVPVPLHWARLWRRRFNQAVLLAEAIAARTGHEVAPRALRRVKRTRPQFGLSRNERAGNLQGAFRVGPGAALAGRRILLIDDVFTTGATANAATRRLLKAGAQSVSLLTFACVASPP